MKRLIQENNIEIICPIHNLKFELLNSRGPYCSEDKPSEGRNCNYSRNLYLKRIDKACKELYEAFNSKR